MLPADSFRRQTAHVSPEASSQLGRKRWEESCARPQMFSTSYQKQLSLAYKHSVSVHIVVVVCLSGVVFVTVTGDQFYQHFVGRKMPISWKFPVKWAATKLSG